MNAPLASRTRIAVVTTRDLNARAGRPGILSNIVATLGRHNDVHVFRLRTVIELSGLADLCGAALFFLAGLARGRPPPLQCLLYSSPRASSRLAREICRGRFDAVYLDTVRCQALLRALRRLAPDLRIVTDFDDLMSRRMEYLARNRQPLLAGHVAPVLPRWLRRIVEGPLSRLVTAYEAATLTHAEAEAIAASDTTVLLSQVECLELRAALPAALRARLRAIPPALHIRAEPWDPSAPLRFVFIGSDDFLQNRHAIDRLLAIWQSLAPATPLHIYGRQARTPIAISGVHWHGFVDDLAEVYRPGSIAILPALDSGGIKTKVAEAWAWGCPVIGNDAALQSLPVARYPLRLAEEAWAPFIRDPAAHVAALRDAARLGSEFVRQNLSFAAFERAWQSAMQPEPVLRLAPAQASPLPLALAELPAE